MSGPPSPPPGSPAASPPPSSPADSPVQATCPCETTQDPQVVTNPPGLTAISYRADDFTGFRRALLTPLDGETSLGPWRPAPADLGLQMLEWWAYLADILTFYNERIANEAYLGTAQFPDSIAGLVALLGYTPAPGLAATGLVGAIRTSTRPGEALVIPAGMQISSTATPGVPAQTFEAAAGTFPGASDVLATLPPDPDLPVTATGPASVLLAGKVTGAKPGDQLLLAEAGWAGNDDNWSLVTVGMVSPETDPGTGTVNTRVAFTSTAVWGTTPDPTLITARGTDRRARLAAVTEARALNPGSPGGRFRDPVTPAAAARRATDYRLMKPTGAASLWNLGSPPDPVSTDGTTVNLSAAVRSIQPGDLLLFDGGSQAPSVLASVLTIADAIATVPFPDAPATTVTKTTTNPPSTTTTATSTTTPPPPIVVTQSKLTVASDDLLTVAGFSSQPDAVAVRYGFRDLGTIIGNPVGTLPSLPATVVIPGAFTVPPGASMALAEDPTGAGALVTVAPGPALPGAPATLAIAAASSATSASSTPVSFDPPLLAPLRLLFDLVAVSRGSTVTAETLGSGDAAVANQSFTLKKSPLAYLASGAGWSSTLQVFVDQIRWSEVPSLYQQPFGAQVYVIQRNPDLSATVRFGDGVNGARLTTGNGNVVATYRYGSGAASPPAGRLTTIIKRQANLAAIHNPVAVLGGRDPQSPADVKTNAPASVFSFGRAISAADYEAIASQAAGVTRAKAYWTFDAGAQRTLVKIYVNDDAGGVAAASQALAGADDPNRPVTVSPAQAIGVSVTCTLLVAADRAVSDVVAAATAAFSDPGTGAFSPVQMGIGQRLYRSHVEAALTVPGVVAVHQLSVTWTSAAPRPLELIFFRQLDQAADPGEGAYFALLPANLTILGVPSSG
ncbi:MAG: baseplate J/gp47 family protein [Streptosporangiaceae bacterium]